MSGRKRHQTPSPAGAPSQKHHAPLTEGDDFDEDVFLEDTLIADDIEHRQALSSRFAIWSRRPLSPSYINQSINIVFQQLEIDHVIVNSHKELLPIRSGLSAMVRIFGVTHQGHSVCCNVHGFDPYFYISCPPGMDPDHISCFREILERRMKEANRNVKLSDFILRIELVERRSIMHYQQQLSHPFLKIVVALPNMVATRGILDRGIDIDGLGKHCFTTYESNVLYALRFMIDCNIVGGNWIAYLISHAPEGEFSKMAPFRILSFDIACASRKLHDPVIQHTKKLVKEKFTVVGGYEHNAEVIYGDTDSVMVQFGVSTVEDAMKLGREAAEHISGTFIKPIKLEFEKVYFPYLLISKKRYAGLSWTNPDKYDKMDTKGIETVRRDNCLFVKNLVTECLHKILIDRDFKAAIQLVKNTISDLLMNRLDLSLLVITKGLSKTGNDYKVKTAHVELAERMRERDAATAPGVGDRVPYVIIKDSKNAKAYQKSEDPIYVLENNKPIDTKYYLENQIEKPILRIFEPILTNARQELFHGAHTRSISISTPLTGGIMKFAKKLPTCMGCKAVIRGSHKPVCSDCKGREAELYCKTRANVSEIETLLGKLWSQCLECQGSLHQDVLCTSNDCPIFYRRKKAEKDMGEAKVQLDRWDF